MNRMLLPAAGRSDANAMTNTSHWAGRDNEGAQVPAPVHSGPDGYIAHGTAEDVVVLSQTLALLRESEGRFRRLTALSADWHWRQDEDLRFKPQDGGTPSHSGLVSVEDIGKTRWELPIFGVSDAQWQAHREALAARQSFRDFEFQRKCPDGRIRYVSVSGEPTFDPSGRFTGYLGVGRDITEKKRTDQMAELEHALARLLAGANETSVALTAVIQAICDTENWDCGQYWRLDEADGVFRANQSWSRSNPVIDSYFAEYRSRVFGPGTALVGHVAKSGQPLWVADLGHGELVHDLSLANSIGLHSACLFPVAVEGRITGVFAFMSGEIHDPDSRLLAAMLAMGSQVGQFLERKQGEQELCASEARYRALTAMSADWYWEHDENQRLTKVSDHVRADQETGIEARLGETRWETDIRYNAAERTALEADIEARRPFREFKFTRIATSGAERHAQISGEPMYNAAGRYCGYRGIGQDITGRIQAEHAIRTSSMQQGLIAKFGQQALAVTNINALLGGAVTAIVEGLGADCCSLLRFGADACPIVLEAGAGWDHGWLGRALNETGPGTRIGYLFERREPLVVEDFAAESRFAPSEILTVHGIESGLEVVIGGTGAPYGVLGCYSRKPRTFSPENLNFLQSIANTLGTAVERGYAEQKIAYQARYDSLTGLANRELFRDRLAQNLAEAERDECKVGVLYIDLNGFKGINDTYGHEAGDRLLTLVAERLRSCVRQNDTVGRLGGDEFAIVITNLADADDADRVAEQIVEQLAQPFNLDDRETLITASIGISVYPLDGTDANLLLKNADTAMYQGKEQGRNNFQNYSVELDDAASVRRQLALELRHAIEHEEFELYYQPQVTLDSERIIGVEAMLRWRHPVRGILAAGEFIDVAEETGLIVQIGQWVFETACKQTAEWQRGGYPDLFVSVNVSPVEIRRGRVAEQVQKALERSGLAPRHLEIELTDCVLIDDVESFASRLTDLKDLGISIAIDDFGTGYSSLGSLKKFPIDKVKIDQTFTRDIATDPDDSAIVQAVIAMAHHLRLEVGSKGVETGGQAGFLRRCRCDIAQGFLFGAPMSVGDLEELLDDADDRAPPARQPLRGSARTFALAAVA